MQQDLPESIANRYRVLERLGEGGIGVVYEAFDPVLNKKVAVKVLLNLSDDLKVRFHKEAKAAGKLKHRNIISVLDFGLTKEQQPYMVMECLEGTTLASHIASRGALALLDAADILFQICDGLEHAHKNGVLHRDIKPGNIMLTDIDNEEPRAVIVDFGLAKLWSGDQSLTASGQMKGSPYYMSPEQVNAGEVDARTDIYSLGCLIFEVLSGHPPFQGDSAQETMSMQVNAPPPSLSSVSGQEFQPELEAILSRCLAKKKEGRFDSIEALRAELMNCCADAATVNGDSVAPPAPEIPEANATGVKPVNRKILFAAMAVVLAGVLLVVNISTQRRTADSFDSLKTAIKLEGNPNEVVAEYGPYAANLLNSRVKGRTTAEMFDIGSQPKNVQRSNRLQVDRLLRDHYATSVKLGSIFLSEQDLVRLGSMPNLKELNWSDGLDISKDAFEHLTGSKILKTMILRNVHICDEALASIGKIESLEILDLSSAYGFTNKSLSYLVKNKKLHHLDLEGYEGLTDEGLKYISQIENLEFLNLDRTDDYRGTGFDQLAKLKHLKNFVTTLKHLSPDEAKKRYETINKISSLSNLCLGNPDFANLGMLAAHRHLHAIVLRASDFAGNDIAQLIKLKNVKTFQIFRGMVDARSLKVLAATKALALSFTECEFPEGLSPLKNAQQLRLIEFKYCKVTPAEIKDLKKSLKECDVELIPLF